MSLITTQEELKKVLCVFEKSEFLTIDTEFIRENTFWPDLCLIQLASPVMSAVIDVLSPGINLDPLFVLLKNEKILKVFHAARQDIEIIVHLAGFIPSPLFDTQIAAMACGFGEDIAYDKLVFLITGHSLDKSLRSTNWQNRPLCQKQIHYALADVTFLLDVYCFLQKRLESQNRCDWIEKEMAFLSSMETYDSDPQKAWKRFSFQTEKSVEFALLRSVAAWREELAQKKNVPRNRIMKDDILLQICRKKPKNRSDLERLRFFSRKGAYPEDTETLLEIIRRTLALLPQDLLAPPPLRPFYDKSTAKVELLKVLLRWVCEKEEVSSRLVATAAEIAQLAAEGENACVPALKGWRHDIFGKKALQLLAGNIALKIEKDQISLMES